MAWALATSGDEGVKADVNLMIGFLPLEDEPILRRTFLAIFLVVLLIREMKVMIVVEGGMKGMGIGERCF